MWNFGGDPMWWGFGFFGFISMLAWWILIIAALIAFVRWLLGYRSREEKSPTEILKERYAHGEIDKKEFEEKKRELA